MNRSCSAFLAAYALASGVAHAADAKLAMDAAPTAVALKAGEAGKMAFTAEAGQRLLFTVTAIAMTPASKSGIGFIVRQPDGTPVPGLEMVFCVPSPRPCTREFASSAAGTYTVEVDMPFSAAASYSAAVSKVKTAVAGEGAMEIASQGTEPLRFEFNAAAGQAFTIGIDKLVHTPDVDSNSRVALFKSDGTRVAGTGCSTPSRGARAPCIFSTPKLEAGSYAVVVNAPPRASVAGTLYRMADVEAQLDKKGPTRVDLQPGQRVLYAVPVKTGEKVGLEIVRANPGDKAIVNAKLVKATGGLVFMRGLFPAEAQARVEPLPVTADDTLTLSLDAGFNKASVTFTVIR